MGKNALLDAITESYGGNANSLMSGLRNGFQYRGPQQAGMPSARQFGESLSMSGVPVVSDLASGALAAADAANGDYGSAALNAVGVLPFVPAMGGTIAKHGELYRGLSEKFNPSIKRAVEWYSETPELAGIYGKNIIKKPQSSGIEVTDLGFRDYMTEVKQDNVLDRVKRSIVDSFNSGKIDKQKAIALNDQLEDMRTGSSEYKRAHEWINGDIRVSSILKNSGYDAISHVENGNQTYGFLKP